MLYSECNEIMQFLLVRSVRVNVERSLTQKIPFLHQRWRNKESINFSPHNTSNPTVTKIRTQTQRMFAQSETQEILCRLFYEIGKRGLPEPQWIDTTGERFLQVGPARISLSRSHPHCENINTEENVETTLIESVDDALDLLLNAVVHWNMGVGIPSSQTNGFMQDWCVFFSDATSMDEFEGISLPIPPEATVVEKYYKDAYKIMIIRCPVEKSPELVKALKLVPGVVGIEENLSRSQKHL